MDDRMKPKHMSNCHGKLNSNITTKTETNQQMWKNTIQIPNVSYIMKHRMSLPKWRIRVQRDWKTCHILMFHQKNWMELNNHSSSYRTTHDFFHYSMPENILNNPCTYLQQLTVLKTWPCPWIGRGFLAWPSLDHLISTTWLSSRFRLPPCTK